MHYNHIHFIVNPAAGKEEPIVSYINRIFEDTVIDWDITITKKHTNLATLTRKLAGTAQLLAVYGGDGTVTEVAAALHGQPIPMAIVPGGTANVMAKELGLPTDTETMLYLLAKKAVAIRAIDMGVLNGQPFLLRINLGLMAEMVLQTDRKLKDDLGQIAYGITALRTMTNARELNLKLTVDGSEFTEKGVALMVTNSGNTGIGDLAVLPGISITDGLLDVVLLRDVDIFSILKVAGSTLLQTDTDAYRHWSGKHVIIELEEEHAYVCDDGEASARVLDIRVVPHSINMVVPA